MLSTGKNLYFFRETNLYEALAILVLEVKSYVSVSVGVGVDSKFSENGDHTAPSEVLLNVKKVLQTVYMEFEVFFIWGGVSSLATLYEFGRNVPDIFLFI